MNDEFVEREYEERILEGLRMLKDNGLVPELDKFVLPTLKILPYSAGAFYTFAAIVYASEKKINEEKSQSDSQLPIEHIIRELGSSNMVSAFSEIEETMSKYFFRLMIDNDPHRKELLFAYNSYGRILLMIKKGIEDYNTRLN